MPQIDILAGDAAIDVNCGANGSVVTNNGPATVYYGTTPATTDKANSGSVASGVSAALVGEQFFYVASGRARVTIVPAARSAATATQFYLSDYGAVGDGKMAVDGAITNGQAVLTSATAGFTSADVGKVILVNKAAGVDCLRATILSVQSATQVTLSANATATVTAATFFWGTDDTAAIQAAVDACATANAVDVIGQARRYIVDGPLKLAATCKLGTDIALKYRAQITVPQVDPATHDQVTIRLIGPTPCGRPEGYLAGWGADIALVAPTMEFISTRTGGAYDATNGVPAVIGGPDTIANPIFGHGSANSWAGYTSVDFRMENMVVRCPDNPSYAAANLRLCFSAKVRETRFATTSGALNMSQPTHPTGSGLQMPTQDNDNDCRVANVQIQGFYGGFYPGEHAQTDMLALFLNVVAIIPLEMRHVWRANYISAEANQHVIATVDPSTGAAGISYACLLDVDCLDIEDSTAGGQWYFPVDHVWDAGSNIKGRIGYYIFAEKALVVAGTTLVNTIRLTAALPGSRLAYAPITAPLSTASNTLVDAAGLTITITALAGGRPIELELVIPVLNNSADQGISQVAIMEGATQITVGNAVASGANSGQAIVAKAQIVPSAGAHTYKVQYRASTATTTATLYADPTSPAYVTATQK